MFGDDSHFEYNTLEQKEPFARGAVPRWRLWLECDWTLNKFKRSTGAFNLRRSLGRRVSGKKDNKLDVIVHEWLSRPHDERLTTNQAVLFAEKAKSRYDFHDHQVIFDQLSKHVGKSYRAKFATASFFTLMVGPCSGTTLGPLPFGRAWIP